MKKYLRMSSAAVVIGALRVKPIALRKAKFVYNFAFLSAKGLNCEQLQSVNPDHTVLIIARSVSIFRSSLNMCQNPFPVSLHLVSVALYKYI